MSRLNLLGGTYLARSIIANAQRCVNLYPEKNPQDAAAPVTHYPTPGLKLQVVPLTSGAGRCLYTATNGKLYYVCGKGVYFISSGFVQTLLGNLSVVGTTPVSMVDNGNVIIIVDGTSKGYAINLADNTFGQIIDPAYLGADRVDFLDTYFVLNQPGTKNFYCSHSNVSFANLCTNPGVPQSGTIIGGGSGYVNGTYTNVPLTGGTGNGAQASSITVSGGAVTSVTLNTSLGLGYLPGDILSASNANLGGSGSGFSYEINTATAAAFDPTFVAAKTGFPDVLSTLLVVHREIWLFGSVKTSEVWYDSGGATFPFAIIPGVFIEEGCVAKYSPQKYDLLVFWLAINEKGQGTVFMGAGYAAKKISTPAIAYAFSNYSRIDDAVGMMYMKADHIFYVLSFPTANATWVYDVSEGLWHEWTYTDPNTGSENRHRANCFAIAYGMVLCGDWQNGNIYTVDFNTYDDNGAPIVRRRGMPHIVDELVRITHSRFILDMECGRGISAQPSLAPQVSLRVSDDRGRTWWQAPTQSMGLPGQYLVQPKWGQLGMARDRVYEVYWSDPAPTAINGAYVEFDVTGALGVKPRGT